MSIFYRPPDAVAGDFIPFFYQGVYHLFYLKDYRQRPISAYHTAWYHVVTRDFVTFEDWGEALSPGAADAQDASVWTGSVLEHDGQFSIYYTGHNHEYAGTGKPLQVVMRATSADLRSWHKDPDFVLSAPTSMGYEQDDWRDPFVVWNDAAHQYWMLITARVAAGPDRSRGCIALATSADLDRWEVHDPLWSPGEFYALPCPDVFRIGDWWYLVFAISRDGLVTHYRKSRELNEPWLAATNPTLDGRAFGAAKTAGSEHERYVFGWLPTRTNDSDNGEWQWGGDLVVHRVVQQPDGALTVSIPAGVVSAFSQPIALQPQPVLGEWDGHEGDISTSGYDRFSALLLGRVPATCLIQTTVTFTEGTTSFGLFLRASEDLNRYYQVRFEPSNCRFVIDRWPRSGDRTFNAPFILERAVTLAPETPLKIQIIIDGSCLVIYAADQVALSGRIYDFQDGQVGLFVTEGHAHFQGTSLRGQSGTRDG